MNALDPNRTPADRARRAWAAYAGLGVVAVIGAWLGDEWVYAHLTLPDVYEHDWGRLFRLAGYLPVWIVVAAGMACARVRFRGWRGVVFAPEGRVLLAATLGGTLAEPLKLLIRGDRPRAGLGLHHYYTWTAHPWSTGGLGMPSSHTLVAFSAAAMLARCFPRGGVLWFALATGCGVTRVLSGAHFLSDVVAAALLGPLVAAMASRWLGQWSPAVLDEAGGDGQS